MPDGFWYNEGMKINHDKMPRVPEFEKHVAAAMNRYEARALVETHESDMAHNYGEVYFLPVVRYRDGYEVKTTAICDCGDLPDFSPTLKDEEGNEYRDGSRQCFVWGYANLEDALAVVRALNYRYTEGR